ncbi:MAG TPA: hypothetical protein VGU20_11005 [Stellaceae bacterium]|nr:hypothetical protein [Stellaceae bacterium]
MRAGTFKSLGGTAVIVFWPAFADAQMAGPTPQPQGVPVTPVEAVALQPEIWAIHGQATSVWLLQPRFHSPYEGPHSCETSQPQQPCGGDREFIAA